MTSAREFVADSDSPAKSQEHSLRAFAVGAE